MRFARLTAAAAAFRRSVSSSVTSSESPSSSVALGDAESVTVVSAVASPYVDPVPSDSSESSAGPSGPPSSRGSLGRTPNHRSDLLAVWIVPSIVLRVLRPATSPPSAPSPAPAARAPRRAHRSGAKAVQMRRMVRSGERTRVEMR